MATETFYDEDFRSIGQALEAKNIRVFELRRLGDWYILTAMPQEDGSLRSKVHKFKLRFRSGSDLESLILALSDVQELSGKGKAERFKPGRIPDFRRLSNILRTIGAYLDSKEAKLIELKVRPFSITLSYQDTDGQQQIEDRTIRSFHGLFLELYGKRGKGKGGSKIQQLEG
jgi:hypothetical protein